MNSSRFVAIVLLASICCLRVSGADAPEVIQLWPKGAPGEQGNIGEEKDASKPNEGLVAGKPVIRLGNVSNPTLTVYRPSKEKDTGAAVVVCPGGGYRILALDLEGSEVCEWLNSLGVTAALLKYRVPVRAGQERYAAPLQDAQRALGIIRSHAKEWNLNPKHIGILGFSAGGHLSATASNNYLKRTYDTIDAADEVSCRPDFTLLVYPAYLTAKEDPYQLAAEVCVTSNTPPAFILQTEDDAVKVECSLAYAMALKKSKVPMELHIYPVGGHGYGMRPTDKPVTHWPMLAEQWLRNSGFLTKEQTK
ncbi:alpha/beta hydrolase [Pedosphaera parvula]|uniref:Xylanase n=1 Tax=Pedosphaera parvula (strain Ellin514) TaxID=320771 RepID=B9XGT3_PEDPL|nr:alpha/beta hydrolase [Pedosphaera parvula]EEF60854.1 xylanase [Pedosphaera parvula Ellin514]